MVDFLMEVTLIIFKELLRNFWLAYNFHVFDAQCFFVKL